MKSLASPLTLLLPTLLTCVLADTYGAPAAPVATYDTYSAPKYNTGNNAYAKNDVVHTHHHYYHQGGPPRQVVQRPPPQVVYRPPPQPVYVQPPRPQYVPPPQPVYQQPQPIYQEPVYAQAYNYDSECYDYDLDCLKKIVRDDLGIDFTQSGRSGRFVEVEDPYVKRKELIRSGLILGAGILKGALITTLINTAQNNNNGK